MNSSTHDLFPHFFGRMQVGFACFCRTTSTLYLCQYVESTRSFTTTKTMLEVHSPDILLTCAPSTSTVSTLDTTGFLSAFQSYEQTPLPRGMFDDTEGLVLVQMCASPSSNMDLTDSRGSYLAFGAAGALLKHTQEHLGLVLTSNSLRVFSAETPFHTHINAASIDALQLVQSNTLSTTSTQQPFFSGNTNNTSLLKFLDATTTRAGAQLLRSNILQPLRDIPTLQARYDAIDELLEKEDLLSSLHGCLKQLPKNMDSVCGNLVLRPSKSSNNMIQRIAAAIQSFIQLREIITTLGPLRDALQEADSELLCALHSTCSTSEFEELLARLDGLLDDDIHSSSSAFLNRTQQCFALRNGVNPLLDIARQTFCKATEAVHEHADEMRELHDFSALKVQYTARRGFFFSIPLPSLHNTSSNTDAPLASPTPAVAKRRRPFPPPGTARDRRAVRLPSSFTFLQVHHNTVQCTTEALNALNTRLQDSSNDCLCLTEEVLDQTSKEIIEQCLSLLHRLIDGIALLDMLCGFAHKIKSSASPYVRPVLTSMGPIALVDCRHPVLESMPCCASFQPNDTWLALDSSFHIIAGPNMSGKSTYLQQIALAVIMAQIGFYVPASFASVTPVDKIFTRMGTRDDIETSSSSFMEEMEVAVLLMQFCFLPFLFLTLIV